MVSREDCMRLGTGEPVPLEPIRLRRLLAMPLDGQEQVKSWSRQSHGWCFWRSRADLFLPLCPGRVMAVLVFWLFSGMPLK